MWRLQLSIDSKYTDRKYPTQDAAIRARDEVLKPRTSKQGKKYITHIPAGWTAITRSDRRVP